MKDVIVSSLSSFGWIWIFLNKFPLSSYCWTKFSDCLWSHAFMINATVRFKNFGIVPYVYILCENFHYMVILWLCREEKHLINTWEWFFCRLQTWHLTSIGIVKWKFFCVSMLSTYCNVLRSGIRTCKSFPMFSSFVVHFTCDFMFICILTVLTRLWRKWEYRKDYKYITRVWQFTLDSIFQFQNQITCFGFLLAYALPIAIVFSHVSR